MSNQKFLFKTYVPLILEKIDQYITLNKEFEVRFHQLLKTEDRKKPWYGSPVDTTTFFRVKSYFQNKYGTATEIHSEDKIKSGKRQSVITTEDGQEKIVTIQKNRLWDSKVANESGIGPDLFNNIGFRLSMSSETETEEAEFKDPDIIRNKHRYSWKDILFQFDITQVNSTEKGQPTKSSWEVEVEVLHPIFQGRNKNEKLTAEEKETVYVIMYKLYIQITNLLKVINNTDLAYMKNEYMRVQEFVNSSVNESSRRYEDFIVKARDLKYPDMVYGGLVGGRIDYTVTPKAKGLRKFLIVDDYGIWLIFPGKEFCLVEKAPADAAKYTEWKWFPFRKTILDGEDIQIENRQNSMLNDTSKHYYLPFDALYYAGEDVRNRTLAERLKLADFIVNKIGSSSDLVLEKKPFLTLGKTADSFFREVKNVFNMLDGLNYKTDGVMFTPINSPYNPGSDKIKGPQRNLTRYPDICKWKPADEYTIDLKVIQTPTKRALYASWGDEDVEFKGTDFYEFDSENQVDWLDPLFYNIPNGTIVEFGPKMNSDGKKVFFDEDKIILRPILIREDKPYANSKVTASDVWNDLNDPILQDTLLGKTTRLVRKYHNQIKRKLLDTPPTDDNHLIDIGSGRGGDITKMKKFSRILSIEPNEENMKEFKRRLSQENKDIQNKFATLIAGGEEYERIIEAIRVTFGDSFGTKPLYISMMLSLSFFWKSKEMLQQLANTLNLIKEEYYKNVPKNMKGKNTVKFLFLTIEGERVINFLSENGSSVQLNDAFFSYKDGIVYVDFPGTIVEKQVEYPVILSELRNLTDMNRILERDANEEKFLSENEMKYTSLYVYGEYELLNKPFYLFRKEEEEDFIPDIVFPEEVIKEVAVEIPEYSSLFACLYQAFNPTNLSSMKPQYVLLYRKEISDAISETNPYDLDGRTIFASAGNGFLERVSENMDHAKAWILSENELTPEYISWIPDTIGCNIQVNGVEYMTSSPSSKTILLDYEPKINVYTLV